jgi:hypothetical protein
MSSRTRQDRQVTRLRPFASVAPRPGETLAALPGDDLLPHADVVMDRAFSLRASPADVWPWLVQLGKGRAGWYLPRSVDRLVPPSRRALRRVDPRWQDLDVGDVVPDYGGKHETFTVAAIDRRRTLLYTSRRGHTEVTWVLFLTPEDDGHGPRTRVHLRLRLGPVRHVRAAERLGGAFDLLTVAGLAAGLRERVEVPDGTGPSVPRTA